MAKGVIDQPFGLARFSIIEDFLLENPHYIENLSKQLENYNETYPIVRIKLKDVLNHDANLFSHIRDDPETAIEDFCDRILEIARRNAGVSEMLRAEKCKFEQIHLIFDLEDVEELIPTFENFSLGTKPYDFKLTRIIARFLDLQLHREKIATTLKYRCIFGHDFEIMQFKDVKGKYKTPKFCIKKGCKAKARSDFDIINVEEYREMGHFRISDLDFAKQMEKDCYTFINYDYFSEKVQNINLNDNIEIIGIFKNDYSEIGTRKENQIIREYFKVIDFRPIELKDTNPAIVKELYDKFRENRNYHHVLLDSIHPITKGIYTYRLFKLVILLGIISSDSWDTIVKNRCTINTITGSIPSSYKGSIVSAFREILGISNVGRISGQDNTPKAFIPTSQRGRENDFQVRYGAFAYNNKRFLPIDEAQYMLNDPNLIKPIKYLEDGSIDRGSDGTILFAECKLSVAFLMNYFNEANLQGYDYTETLKRNLGIREESVLQRIDLHYTMNNLPTQLSDIVERRSFRRKGGDIDVNTLYNWINEVKRIYPLQKINSDMENKLIQYIKLLRAKRGLKRQNIRELRTLIKLVCGISAIRLKTEIDISDLEYIQQHLVDLMIPFFEYQAVRELKLMHLDMNETFQNTLSLMTEINKSIDIAEHIALIRIFLENHYFPYESYGFGYGHYNQSKSLDDYMPEKFNTENTKYRKLYKNPENRDFIEKTGYIITKYKTRTHYVKKSFFKETLLKEIAEIMEIEEDPIEIEWLREEIPYTSTPDTFKQIIDEMISSGELIRLKKNHIKLP